MPWPKGRPLPPEMVAEISERTRRQHAEMTDEQKSIGAAKRSAAMKARRAADTAKNRAWRRKSADNLCKARQALSPDARRKSAEALRAYHAAKIAHLSAEQVDEYRRLRRRHFRHAEALSLVTTGRMS